MSTIVEHESWLSFKTAVDSAEVILRYIEKSTLYDLYANDDKTKHVYRIIKESPALSDQSDFETNYKPSANRKDRTLVAGHDVEYVVETYTTTNSFLSVRPTNGDFNTRRMKSKSIFIENTGSNSVDIRIRANFSDTSGNFTMVLLNQTIAAGDNLLYSEDRAFQQIRVLAKSTTSGQSSTVKTRGYAIGV
jgi:hypothetical protein